VFDLNMIRFTDKRQFERDPSLLRNRMLYPADTLNKVKEFISRYVSLTESQAVVVSLWVVHTHITYLAQATPYLAVTSKRKRSGKTRLLETVELLVSEPLRTANITEAALFRALAESTKTLLLDEVDTVFGEGKSRELLRAILNASYRRGSPVIRTQGKGVEAFDVFCPKMIAGIGELPDTVADRSIPIRLERMSPPQRFRMSEVEAEGAALKELVRTTYLDEQMLTDIYKARPELPAHLHDREQDSWEPLLQIAVCSGWTDEVYQATQDLYDRQPWEKERDSG
jgi:hypothetical protein